MDAANAKSHSTQVESEGSFRSDLAISTRASRGLARCVCASNRIPPQLYRPARTWGKEPLPQCSLWFIRRVRATALANARASRETARAL